MWGIVQGFVGAVGAVAGVGGVEDEVERRARVVGYEDARRAWLARKRDHSWARPRWRDVCGSSVEVGMVVLGGGGVVGRERGGRRWFRRGGDAGGEGRCAAALGCGWCGEDEFESDDGSEDDERWVVRREVVDMWVCDVR